MPDRPLRRSDWLLTGLLTLAALASIAYASVKPRHLAGEVLGVIVIGGRSEAAMAAIADAGGLVLRDGVMAGSVVGRAPDAGFLDRLTARLRNHGLSFIYRIDRDINCAGAIALPPATAQQVSAKD